MQPIQAMEHAPNTALSLSRLLRVWAYAQVLPLSFVSGASPRESERAGSPSNDRAVLHGRLANGRLDAHCPAPLGCRVMALARIEILVGLGIDEKSALVEAVSAALSDALQAPPEDPAVRLAEYPRGQFSIPYPDRHSDRYTLVEVTMFAGRSPQTKRRLYSAIVERLTALGVPSNDVLIVLHEPPMENWAVDGGIPASEVDVGFKVDI